MVLDLHFGDGCECSCARIKWPIDFQVCSYSASSMLTMSIRVFIHETIVYLNTSCKRKRKGHMFGWLLFQLYLKKSLFPHSAKDCLLPKNLIKKLVDKPKLILKINKKPKLIVVVQWMRIWWIDYDLLDPFINLLPLFLWVSVINNKKSMVEVLSDPFSHVDMFGRKILNSLDSQKNLICCHTPKECYNIGTTTVSQAWI